MENKNIIKSVKLEREKNLEPKLRKKVESLGGLCLKMLALHYAGLPDRLVLLPEGKIFFAELKTTKEKPSKIQMHVHAQIRKLGFKVYVLDTTEKIEQALKDHE